MTSHHPQRFLPWGLACALALVLMPLAACDNIKPSESDARETTLDDFAGTMRWGDFAAAYTNFVDPDTRRDHPLTDLELERFKQVEVSGYEVTGNVVGANTVDRVIKLDLINRHTQIPRTVIYKEHWRWDATIKHWWLVSGIPDISPQD